MLMLILMTLNLTLTLTLKTFVRLVLVVDSGESEANCTQNGLIVKTDHMMKEGHS